jgi:adenylate kinase family enzyme
MLTPPTLPKPAHEFDRVAFAGPMCSGKTTLADILVNDYDYVKVSFAGLLKQTAKTLYGVVEKNNEGRKLLQELADDLKKWDANLFTTHLLLDIEDYITEGEIKFVLDDLRFQHEFDALKNAGFTIVGTKCRDDVRLQRIAKLYPDTDPSRFEHPSERGWETMNMDYWVDTTGLHAEQFIRHIALKSQETELQHVAV